MGSIGSCWEDSTCLEATKPLHHTAEPRPPGAHELQQEKPPQGEALSPQRRVALAHGYYRKPMCSNKDPLQTGKEKNSLKATGFILYQE